MEIATYSISKKAGKQLPRIRSSQTPVLSVPYLHYQAQRSAFATKGTDCLEILSASFKVPAKAIRAGAGT